MSVENMNLEVLTKGNTLFYLASTLNGKNGKDPAITQLMKEILDQPTVDHSEKFKALFDFNIVRAIGEDFNENSLVSYEVVSKKSANIASFINILKEDVEYSKVGSNLTSENFEQINILNNSSIIRIGDSIYTSRIFTDAYDAYYDYQERDFYEITQHIEAEKTKKPKVKKITYFTYNEHNQFDVNNHHSKTLPQIYEEMQLLEPNIKFNFVDDNINSPYASDRNQAFISAFGARTIASLVDCEPNINGSLYDYLLCECLPVCWHTKEDLTISDFWDHLPTEKQEQLINAMLQVNILDLGSTDKKLQLIEYIKKADPEDKFSEQICFYQAKEVVAENKANRSMCFYDKDDARAAFKELNNLKINTPAPRPKF